MQAKINELIFGPDQDIEKFVIDNIDRAKQEIKMMVFWFTWKPIAEALNRASERGVNISIILDSRSAEDKKKDVCKLNEVLVPNMLSDKIETRIYNGELLHHKIILIDKNIILTGTCNFFNGSLKRHEEHYMKVTSDDLHARFLQRFMLLKEKSKHWSKR
tara:strand:- start:60200 stop:60679 length:480 start_codon:yes stop_codon:yes gene_type:complete